LAETRCRRRGRGRGDEDRGDEDGDEDEDEDEDGERCDESSGERGEGTGGRSELASAASVTTPTSRRI
jgi:hypothetical protein